MVLLCRFRQYFVYKLQGIQYVHFLAIVLAAMTTFWYAAVWTALLFVGASLYCPTFTRLGGWIGKNSI